MSSGEIFFHPRPVIIPEVCTYPGPAADDNLAPHLERPPENLRHAVNRAGSRGHSFTVEDPDHDQAFVQLLTEHQAAILAYIRSLMPGYPGVRDIQQLTNLTLWKKKNDFTLGTSFKAWAFAVARFQVRSQRRRLRREGWLVFDDELARQFASESPSAPDDLSDTHLALQKCLGGLRETDQRLLKKRYMESGTLDDYAAELGRSSGTLKTRLFRLRAGLRQCIRRQLAKQGDLA